MPASSRASELDRRSTPAGASVSGSRRTTTVALPGAPASATMPPGADLEALELGEVALDLADEVARRDVEQAVAPGAAADRHDRAVRQEPVGRAAEDPARVGELGLHRRERLEPRAVHEPVQVPPAAAVRDEVERAVGGPLGLDDRLVRAAGREDGVAQGPVRGDRRDPQAGGVPGHVGVVPFEPGELRPVRGEPRRRDEVRPRDEDARVAIAVERDVHDLVDRPRRHGRGPRGPRRSAGGRDRSGGRHTATVRPG